MRALPVGRLAGLVAVIGLQACAEPRRQSGDGGAGLLDGAAAGGAGGRGAGVAGAAGPGGSGDAGGGGGAPATGAAGPGTGGASAEPSKADAGDASPAGADAPTADSGLPTGVECRTSADCPASRFCGAGKCHLDAVEIVAGCYHSCARLVNGDIRCWGDNASGQIGSGNNDDAARPAAVPGLTGASALFAGRESTCALVGGQTFCWGARVFGLAGGTVRTPMEIPLLRTASKLVFADRSGCAVFPDRLVRCWGSNDVGQLGDGAIDPMAEISISLNPVVDLAGVSDVSGGLKYHCAFWSGTVSCWGAGAEGQLGNGAIANSPRPVTVREVYAVSVSSGIAHSCARQTNGNLLCWGNGRSGQLGDGASRDSALPVEVADIGGATWVAAGAHWSCAVLGGGTVHCWGAIPGGGAVRPQAIAGLADATAVTGGCAHWCALRADGAVHCWGNNSNGQLGNGTFAQPNPPTPTLVTDW